MNVTIIEDDRLFIRPITAADSEEYMRIQQENSEISNAYNGESFRNSFWEKTLGSEEDINMMIYLKDNNQHIGNCSFQNVNTSTIEIGIDIDRTWQNQGLGTNTLRLLTAYLKEHASDRLCRVKTKSNNLPCQRIIEKNGGVKIGEETTPFDKIMDQMIPAFQKYGLSQQVEEAEKMLNRNNGICVYVYEFEK